MYAYPKLFLTPNPLPVKVVNIDLFTRVFYSRLFFELDTMRQLKQGVFNADANPDTVQTTRAAMANW